MSPFEQVIAIFIEATSPQLRTLRFWRLPLPSRFITVTLEVVPTYLT